MFRCEQCGSSFNAMRSVGIENCPRCQARDGKKVPLKFKAFELQGNAAKPMSAGGVARPG